MMAEIAGGLEELLLEEAQSDCWWGTTTFNIF
jgi:hypothetical protein